MIKYYSYYNCGGYKDIYIGSDCLSVDATYFVPLLPVWKNRNNHGDKEKINRAEAVTHIGVISNDNSYGFPHECNILFSHGGYKAIYQTLSNDIACLCIKDIDCNSRDEEQRAIPFNFMFIADGEDSISKLDRLAIAYLNSSKQLEKTIQESISYDPILNAIKFDLLKLDQLFDNEISSRICHIPGNIVYLKTTDINKAIKELEIKKENVDAFCDENNIIISGFIRYESLTITEKTFDPQDAYIERENDTNDIKNDVITEKSIKAEYKDVNNLKKQEYKSELDDIKGDIENLFHKISLLSEEIASLKQISQGESSVSNQRFSQIETSISNINQHFDLLQKKICSKDLFLKEIIAYLIVFMAGATLGTILF